MFLFDNNAHKLFVAGESNTVRRVVENRQYIWLSSVAAEELLMGRMDGMNRARSPRNSLSLPQSHEDFAKALDAIAIFPLYVYSPEAEAIFRTFSPATLRIGPQDCRIAAQAMAHGLTVVTRNLQHFDAIGAPCVDWSV